MCVYVCGECVCVCVGGGGGGEGARAGGRKVRWRLLCPFFMSFQKRDLLYTNKFAPTGTFFSVSVDNLSHFFFQQVSSPITV